MTLKTATTAAWFACVAASHSQTLLDDVDAARISASYLQGLGFYGNNGDMDITRYEVRALLSEPIRPNESFLILPIFSYQQTQLDFDGPPADLPFGNEDLHTLSLRANVRSTHTSSPWEFGGLAGVDLSTDFQHINADDFTFDVAASFGYRFSESWVVGLGVAALNLNGDEMIFPGPYIEYTPCKEFAAGINGPNLKVIYQPDENWSFSLRGELAGGDWNVEGDEGVSRTIDIDSYRLGLYADRHLTGGLWLSVGAGVSLFNDLEYTTTSGSRLFKEDLDDGVFGQIALRVKTW